MLAGTDVSKFSTYFCRTLIYHTASLLLNSSYQLCCINSWTKCRCNTRFYQPVIYFHRKGDRAGRQTVPTPRGWRHLKATQQQNEDHQTGSQLPTTTTTTAESATIRDDLEMHPMIGPRDDQRSVLSWSVGNTTTTTTATRTRECTSSTLLQSLLSCSAHVPWLLSDILHLYLPNYISKLIPPAVLTHNRIGIA